MKCKGDRVRICKDEPLQNRNIIPPTTSHSQAKGIFFPPNIGFEVCAWFHIFKGPHEPPIEQNHNNAEVDATLLTLYLKENKSQGKKWKFCWASILGNTCHLTKAVDSLHLWVSVLIEDVSCQQSWCWGLREARGDRQGSETETRATKQELKSLQKRVIKFNGHFQFSTLSFVTYGEQDVKSTQPSLMQKTTP